MKEEAQLTFKPSVNQYHDVRAQLNLRHPEAYLAQVTAKRQAQLAQRLEERRSREVSMHDFALCTQLSLPVAVTIDSVCHNGSVSSCIDPRHVDPLRTFA